MRRGLLLPSVFFVCLGSASGVRAETMPYDHLHIQVPDQAKAVEWYQQHLDAQPPRPNDMPARVRYGNIIVAFIKAQEAGPQSSRGSCIDHIGFSVADVDAKMKELEAAGAKVITPARDVPGQFRAGMVEMWGSAFEILHDPSLIGLHHAHLHLPDPQAALKWYVGMFGGEPTKYMGLDAVKDTNPNFWVLIEKDDKAVPSQGHGLDHLGWHPKDIFATVADFKSKGGKVQTDPRAGAALLISFIEDPWGTRIELVQRPD